MSDITPWIFCYYIRISIINHEQCLECNNQQIRFCVDADFYNGQYLKKLRFMMLCLDWNTLIVGKLSSWIEADSEIENVRRNSEAVSSCPSNVL